MIMCYIVYHDIDMLFEMVWHQNFTNLFLFPAVSLLVEFQDDQKDNDLGDDQDDHDQLPHQSWEAWCHQVQCQAGLSSPLVLGSGGTGTMSPPWG